MTLATYITFASFQVSYLSKVCFITAVLNSNEPWSQQNAPLPNKVFPVIAEQKLSLLWDAIKCCPGNAKAVVKIAWISGALGHVGTKEVPGHFDQIT